MRQLFHPMRQLFLTRMDALLEDYDSDGAGPCWRDDKIKDIIDTRHIFKLQFPNKEWLFFD